MSGGMVGRRVIRLSRNVRVATIGAAYDMSVETDTAARQLQVEYRPESSVHVLHRLGVGLVDLLGQTRPHGGLDREREGPAVRSDPDREDAAWIFGFNRAPSALSVLRLSGETICTLPTEKMAQWYGWSADTAERGRPPTASCGGLCRESTSERTRTAVLCRRLRRAGYWLGWCTRGSSAPWSTGGSACGPGWTCARTCSRSTVFHQHTSCTPRTSWVAVATPRRTPRGTPRSATGRSSCSRPWPPSAAATALRVGTVYRDTGARGAAYALQRTRVYEAFVEHLDARCAATAEYGMIFMDGNGEAIRVAMVRPTPGRQ